MTTLGILKREPVEIRGVSWDDLDNSISARAAAELGYKQPDLADDADAKNREIDRLACEAMRELDIRPFKRATVEAYKQRMEKKHTDWNWAAIDEASVPIFVFSLALSLVLSAVCSAWFLLGLLLTAASVIVGCWASDKTRAVAYWSRSLIANYRQPVPEFALQSALDIKQRCPDADFAVDYLAIRHEPQRQSRDPFLVVLAGGSEYFVEVWNEPSFKAKREA